MHYIYYVVWNYLQTNVNFFYTLLILGYPMTSLLGLEYKIVTKELLDSKVSISECEYDFDLFFAENM